jgi:hypothetical protein
MVASVTMKGGRSKELITRALIDPNAIPTTIAMRQARITGTPDTRSFPSTTPTRPTMQPMDRSMFPELRPG